jgi:hypothetical protein
MRWRQSSPIECCEAYHLDWRIMQRVRNLLWRLISFTQRPDFRRNPVHAIYKRLCWRVRWRLCSEPWLLRLPNGMHIVIPQSGSGALIYYQGWSEPEVASFLIRFLSPNMTFIDVGAHIGEYVLTLYRVCFLFPSLARGAYWQPVLTEFTKRFPLTVVLTGLWEGFVTQYQNRFTIRVVGRIGFLRFPFGKQEGYYHSAGFLFACR